MTIVEKKEGKFVLKCILESYYEMKNDLLTEITYIIEVEGVDVSDLVNDLQKSKNFFDELMPNMQETRFDRLQNNLTRKAYQGLDVFLQNFIGALRLFAMTKVATKYKMIPFLLEYIDQVNLDRHYVDNDSEFPGYDCNSFLRTLTFLLTGFNKFSGQLKVDKFVAFVEAIILRV